MDQIHVTQFNPALPTQLQRTACGIAVMISAVRYFRGLSLDLLSTIQDFASYGRYTRPSVQVSFPGYNINGSQLSVPVSLGDDLKHAKKLLRRFDSVTIDGVERRTEQYKIELQPPVVGQTVYMPTFFIDRGTDARGAVEWLKERWGLKAILVEYVRDGSHAVGSEKHIFTSIEREFLDIFRNIVGQNGPVELGSTIILPSMRLFVMASVSHDEIGRPAGVNYTNRYKSETHVLGVLPGGGKDSVTVVDPAVPHDGAGVREVGLVEIEGGLVGREGGKRDGSHFVVIFE
ncbi:MAG: hypothetical protein QY318_00040 [Candidatus Dojkabacteria bacterium]|nr:MAG: hypothetical protein QY318_00040 [Candidatus Dojkabacteria bacterium]